MCFELKKTCFFQSAMQKTEKKGFFVKMGNTLVTIFQNFNFHFFATFLQKVFFFHFYDSILQFFNTFGTFFKRSHERDEQFLKTSKSADRVIVDIPWGAYFEAAVSGKPVKNPVGAFIASTGSRFT